MQVQTRGGSRIFIGGYESRQPPAGGGGGRGGGGASQTYDFAKNSEKLHEIEKIEGLLRGGGWREAARMQIIHKVYLLWNIERPIITFYRLPTNLRQNNFSVVPVCLFTGEGGYYVTITHDASLPPRPKTFSISCSFSENLAKSYVAPPYKHWRQNPTETLVLAPHFDEP